VLRQHCQAQAIAEAGRARPHDEGHMATRRRLCRLAGRAMNIVFGFRRRRALRRFRPAAVISRRAWPTHITMIWEAQATTYGRVALGLPSDNPTLIP
jgi:hypothetical protein